jgi:hypothetical protein
MIIMAIGPCFTHPCLNYNNTVVLIMQVNRFLTGVLLHGSASIVNVYIVFIVNKVNNYALFCIFKKLLIS